MFRSSFRLPITLLGIPVKIDLSFLLVLPLFAWLIGSQIPGYVALFQRMGLDIEPTPLQRGLTPYWLGLLAALGLFGSVLIHELGHAITARLFGVTTKEITLWFLGGVASFDEVPEQRGAEALVALAGPLTSMLLALLFWWLWQNVATAASTVFILSYLTITNVGLALFNLLPALPLDGGRLLRSLLALGLPRLEATRISVGISQIIAILMGIYGFLTLNIFLLAIAFFVYSAGQAENRYALMTQAFKNLKVSDLMTREVISVPPEMWLSQFRKLIFFKKHTGYPVVENGDPIGFVKPRDAENADEDATVASIMRDPETISADDTAMEALHRIGQSELGRLVVTDSGGRMVGIVSKTDLIRILQDNLTVGKPVGGDHQRPWDS